MLHLWPQLLSSPPTPLIFHRPLLQVSVLIIGTQASRNPPPDHRPPPSILRTSPYEISCALISQRVIERLNCNCHHNLCFFSPTALCLYVFVTPRLQLCVPHGAQCTTGPSELPQRLWKSVTNTPPTAQLGITSQLKIQNFMNIWLQWCPLMEFEQNVKA